MTAIKRPQAALVFAEGSLVAGAAGVAAALFGPGLAFNPLLRDAGFVLPAARLMPGEKTYAALSPGKSADEYYAMIATGTVQNPTDPLPATDPATAGTGPGDALPIPAGTCPIPRILAPSFVTPLKGERGT